MIREFRENDLNIIMQIWADTNIQAHNFISKEYWINNYDMVKEMLPQAEVYVYEKNTRAICFYQREKFMIQSEAVDENTNEKELVMSWCRETNLKL